MTNADDVPYSLSSDAQILQSPEWAEFQAALGNPTTTKSGMGWQWLAIKRTRRYGDYLDVPYGPTLANSESLQPALEALLAEAKQAKAVFVRIEPIGAVSAEQLKAVGARRAEKNFQPQHTLVLDLTNPLADLRGNLNKGRKSALNRAAKAEVSFESSSDPADVEDFLTMLHVTYSRSHIQPHPDGYYRKLAEALLPSSVATLYYATQNGKRIAGVIGLDSPTTRYYLHAASLPEARDVEAASALVWHMIVQAKERALTKFDFFGIAPPNQPDHPWAGFSHFKNSFGGTVVERVGTWEIALQPAKYHGLRLAKRLRKALPK